jgi:hypothetical protein
MTSYNTSYPEDAYFSSVEDQYYKELDEAHSYEVALDQYLKGEISEKPDQPFLVLI